MSLFYDIQEELKSRQVYKYETYSPFFIASWAQHQFNLINNKRKIYWINGLLPNDRLHILFISPAGFMKTYYLRTMAGDDLSIFRGCGTHIGFEQQMTPQSFTGSASLANGSKIKWDGIGKDYESGIMMVDEFKGLISMLQGKDSGEFEAMFLSALNTGRIVKRLVIDRDEYITHFTMWTGIQPCNFSTGSGSGRRLTYLMFTPTEKDNEALRNIRFNSRGRQPDRYKTHALWNKEKAFINDLNNIKEIVFDPDIKKYYEKAGHFHYEAEFYDSLILGTTLAMHDEIGPTIEVSIKDPDIRAIIDRETEWRRKINRNPVHGCIAVMMHDKGGCITLDELFNYADMYSMKTDEVVEAVNQMKQLGRIKQNRDGKLCFVR